MSFCSHDSLLTIFSTFEYHKIVVIKYTYCDKKLYNWLRHAKITRKLEKCDDGCSDDILKAEFNAKITFNTHFV